MQAWLCERRWPKDPDDVSRAPLGPFEGPGAGGFCAGSQSSDSHSLVASTLFCFDYDGKRSKQRSRIPAVLLVLCLLFLLCHNFGYHIPVWTLVPILSQVGFGQTFDHWGRKLRPPKPVPVSIHEIVNMIVQDKTNLFWFSVVELKLGIPVLYVNCRILMSIKAKPSKICK